MIPDAILLNSERKKFRQHLFHTGESKDKTQDEDKRPDSEVLPMSNNTFGRRHLLRLNLEIEKRNSENSATKSNDISAIESTVITPQNNEYKIYHQTDVNRNSIIDCLIDVTPEDICEVTATEITERKTRKKNSTINTIRNLVKATVISSPTETNMSTFDEVEVKEKLDEIQEIKNDDNNDKVKKRTKKYSITNNKIMRKKRNRRSRAIQNEGASLWKPVDACYWRSAGGRNVRLNEISLNLLCEAERNTLKKIALSHLNQQNIDCTINIPKEHHAAARRRWKQLLTIKKKGKTDNAEKGNSKPVNPVFSIDLCQVIENDKAADKAHQDAMAKLDRAGETLYDSNKNQENDGDDEDDGDDNHDEDNNTVVLENNLHSSTNNKLFERRNSDPVIFERTAFNYDNTTRDFEETDLSDYMLNALRTIDTLKEEDEEDTLSNKRKSRLIEALTLSSTSASSICILDRDAEFKPPLPQVPKIVIHSADYIERYALNTVGIFRTGGSKKRVRQMKEDYDNGYVCVITEESNPHDVAALFKEFLRCLPEPLLTRELYQTFLTSAKQLSEFELLECVKQLVWLLPAPNRDTLEVTLRCLRSVADNSQDRVDSDGCLLSGNKMDAQNLATLMAPNILHRCKTYKNPQAYKVDDSLNPEDNKAAIDAVEVMINNNEDLFKIPAEIHHEVLLSLLEEEPETVDYVLRRKSTRSSFIDVLGENEDEINIKISSFKSGKRPSSAGPRTKFCQEEVSFHKSHSFNQGPYKPFVRIRKESTESRPTSTRSDPPDRNSVRKSGLNTPPSRQNRRSASVDDSDPKTKRNSSSPRDSGVVMSATTPPFQRNSFQRSSLRSSLDTRKIVRRPQPRDRDSRDSAYDSGMQGLFSNRTSGATSIHITEDLFDFSNKNKTENLNDENKNETVQSSPVYLSELLEAPSFVTPVQSPAVVTRRKISLPAFTVTDRSSFRIKHKSTSIDGDKPNSKEQSSVKTIDWDNDEHWPDWNINPRESQFPSQETTL